MLLTTPPVDHRWVGLIGFLAKRRVKPIQLRVGYLCLSRPPKNPLAQKWHTWMMGFRIVFLCWWSPPVIILQKTFPCAFMHIHLFRSSLLKIGDTRPWVYDTRTCNRFEHENQSNLSGVVTTVSPFPSSRTLTTRRYSWLDLWWSRCKMIDR
jgi:hypothetical protein